MKNFSHSPLHSTFSATPQRTSQSPKIYLVALSSMWVPLLSTHTILAQALSISLLVSLAHLLTSLPNSTSIFKKTDNDNVSFPLHTLFSVLIIQGKVQTPYGVQALLDLIQAYPALFSHLAFLFPPLFCSSTELIGHRMHYTWSFLPLNIYCFLVVHFVSWSNLSICIKNSKVTHVHWSSNFI